MDNYFKVEPKNLKDHPKFKRTSYGGNENKASSIMDYFSPKAIFEAEGLDINDYRDPEPLLMKILEQNAAEWGHEVSKKENEVPELVKWLYRKSLGLKASTKSGESSQVEQSMGASDTLKVQDKAVAVKIENEPFFKLKCALAIVNSGKAKLSKCGTTLEDLAIRIEIKSVKDSALTTKLEDCQEKKSSLDAYLKELKKKLLLWGALTQTDKIEEETIQEVKNVGDTLLRMDGQLKEAVTEYRKFA